MKKKIFSVAIVAAIALGAGWNVMQSENDMKLSDLALSNVEALANNEETGGGHCVSVCCQTDYSHCASVLSTHCTSYTLYLDTSC